MEELSQWIIGLIGGLAILLSQSPTENTRRYACLLGLLAQPFWFYAAYKSQDWGIFAVCFIATLGWVRGFGQFWFWRILKYKRGAL